MSSPSVLIVGAGTVGSALALTLLKNGVPVRIIDKAGPQIGQKGLGIQPRTLEVHHFLGTLPDFLKVAKELPQTTTNYKLPGGTEISKTFRVNFNAHEDPTPDCPYPNAVMLGQYRQQAILHHHLEKYGCKVEFNTELRSFQQFDDHVLATLVAKDAAGTEIHNSTIKVPYLVGADGAHSIIRKVLGLTFLGDTREDVDMIIGDIEIKSRLNPKTLHIWGDASTKIVTLLPTEVDENKFTFIVSGKDLDYAKTASGRDELIKAINSIMTRNDIEFGELVWVARYRPSIRMVNKFGQGRVFVAGDAGHVHPPMGGQGANSGIQDSINLGWKLALVLKGASPPSLLENYTEERLPVIAAMLNKTTLLLNKALMTTSDGRNQWERGPELKQLGVNYRGSSTLVDESASQESIRDSYSLASDATIHAGDRAPEAPGLYDVAGGSTSLFDIFGPDHHTVLVFSPSVAHTTALSELSSYSKGLFKTVLILPGESKFETTTPQTPADLILHDRDGHAYRTYPSLPGQCTIVVIRPDGVVGAIVSGSEGLIKYIKGVFVSRSA